MNLDELQSIQSRERQATSLQNLRPTFYQDVGEFIQELVRERDRAAERADDPFSSPEVRRLTDDIETAKSTVEAIYERRIGKVVKTASIAAAGMPADDEGLTAEETELFETLVARIERNREQVLDGVLEGEGSDLSCARGGGRTGTPQSQAGTGEPTASDTGAGNAPSDGSRTTKPSVADEPPAEPEPDPDPAPTEAPDPDGDAAAELGLNPTADADEGTVSAADLMGSGAEATEPPATAPPAGAADADGHERPTEDSATPHADDQPATQSAAPADGAGDEGVERTTVRITRDVGEVFGVDERAYDLSRDDIVTLPAENAGPLLERDAAERLE